MIRSSARGGRPRLAVAVLAAALGTASTPALADTGAQIFANRCAVCHGPQAGGIPGSFPSLHDQVVAFAKLPQGRDYLVMVVTTGLMGKLTVAGVSYNGVMPAQSGLSEAEVAAVLSYLASGLGKDESQPAALSPADVSEARKRHPDKSPQATRELRPAAAAQPAASDAQSQPAGVDNGQRAWQHWTLNCQGCHRPDGTGSAGTAPSLAGTVARFLAVPGGREYLGRVPGVATSPLSNADLSELMNWILWRFDKEHLPPAFHPFTAAEMGELRRAPLRLEASQMRTELLAKADEAAAR